MIGSYVRIVTSPEITGKIRAARFDKGGSVFLFHPDAQRADTFPETWLPESAFEECAPPKEVLIINDKQGNLLPKYFRMITDPHTRMGTIIGARFDGDCVRFLFRQDPRLAQTVHDVWLPETALEECTQPTDEQMAVINRKGSQADRIKLTNAQVEKGNSAAQIQSNGEAEATRHSDPQAFRVYSTSWRFKAIRTPFTST